MNPAQKSTLGAAGLLLLLFAGCKGEEKGTQVGSAPPPPPPFTGVTFEDVTQKAAINFQHVNGGFGQKWLPETMGSGLAWIDYDGDGYQDVYFVNSREWTLEEQKEGDKRGKSKSAEWKPIKTPGPAVSGHLFHNNRDGTFTDVTETAHLNVLMYGMGASVADYDNDGKPDLYVTAMGRNYLFHNNGNGTFTDEAEKAGLKDGGWSTSAAWFDYDNDGLLDLIVCHYVKWTPKTDITSSKKGHFSYGTPQQYTGEPLALYHNDGKGHFTNVSQQAGILVNGSGQKAQGKSLGVVICDYDNDGKLDIAVANDTEPNYLLHNEGGGKFKEVGVAMGMAYGDNAQARGAMGIDACDYDRKGHESLIIGNFSNQMLALYHNENGAIFRDVAAQTGVGPASLLSLAFGCFFFDLDNDGWQDMYIANGHIDDDIGEDQKEVTYAEPPLIFRNLGGGNFQNISGDLGAQIKRPIVARGAAYADYDLDGRADIALSTNNGPAYLYHNASTNSNHSLRLELEGTKSNRSAIGALVEVMRGGETQTYRVRSGSSYCSQSELPITVGLGSATQADTITIQWPSGEKTPLNAVAAGKIYRVVEGKGIASERAFGQPVTQSSARK